MPKFEDLAPKFSKTRFKLKISTFVIGYMQNFVRKWIHFSGKCSKWAFGFESKFSKTNDKLEISTFKIGCMRNFVKIMLEIWKTKASRKFQVSLILKCWIVSGCFVIFWGCFGWFWVVLTGFGSFWLVPGFS